MRKYHLPALLFAGVLLMSAVIDLNNLYDYDGQTVPSYIDLNKDNTPFTNPLTDAGATLGRVLFYDKEMSSNRTVACASCHQQEFAFGDTAVASVGLSGGTTGRHSMRLVNPRWGSERRFFWDERAQSLEFQTTQPVQDHIEMGFSGNNGDPDFDSLISRLQAIPYYQTLFYFVFGDSTVTEPRIQRSLAQFIRSIQSFDAKFDQGLALVNGNLNAPFPNYTQQENLGKQLYLDPPPAGGAGCQGCHRAPEFDIDPGARNNNVLGDLNDPNGLDFTNNRAPSLRNLTQTDGTLNGPLMHDGSLHSLMEVVEHYDDINPHPQNPNLDGRLAGPGGQGQTLNLSQNEKDALVAFLITLAGTDIYTAEQWSDPFDSLGNLTLQGVPTAALQPAVEPALEVWPNPTAGAFQVKVTAEMEVQVLDVQGRVIATATVSSQQGFDLSGQAPGLYFVRSSGYLTDEVHARRILLQ